MSSPIECVYIFETDYWFTVASMHVKIDDREIDSLVMGKEEAKQKYDDAVASGNSAFNLNIKED